jgi:uncharacterized protein YraI
MSRKLSQLRISTCLVLILLLAVGLFQTVQASILAGPDGSWLVISSHSYQQDAETQARKYSRDFPSTVVFSSSNGYFVVSIGWARKYQRDGILDDLKYSARIPGDSYFSKGARWVQALWTPNDSHYGDRRTLINATRLVLTRTPTPDVSNPVVPIRPIISDLPPRAAKVAGLENTSDKLLSLRGGPGISFAELVRMRAGTRMTITGKSKSWFRVKLNNGMTGFAHSKYVLLVEVPTIGPDQVTDNNVSIIGPDNANKQNSKNQQQSSLNSGDINTEIKPDQSDQKRVALVFGNSSYQHTTALTNPKNDADAVADSLKKLGFEVVKGLDLTKSGMEASIRDFVRLMPGADVTLFFYAGHAMQVNGINYLIPIDAALADSTAIDFETINFSVILNFMNENDRTIIALLDACRNNPLARNFTRKIGKSRSAFVGRGLAAPTSNTGQMLIGFATAPGEVALDGEGKNSPFTTALLKHMETPGLEIELMLKRVKSDVYEETEGNQSPWNNSALRKEFYFVK